MARRKRNRQAEEEALTEVRLLREEMERYQFAAATMTRHQLYDAQREAEAAVVALAREDVNAFCMHVMRDELTGQPIGSQTEIHGRWHALANAHRRLILWAHVEAAKTAQISVARTLWLLGRNSNLRLAIVSNTHEQATKVVRTIGRLIGQSAELRQVFPGLRPDPSAPWTQDRLFLVRQTPSKDPSLVAYGVHGNVLGSRIDGLVLDDVLDYENTRTKAQRDDLYNWYHSTLAGRLTEDAFVLAVGNAHHHDDLLHRLASQPLWTSHRFPVADSAGTPHWPERWPRERIERKRLELGPLEFARQMMCEARDDAEARFKREWIDRCLERGRGRQLAYALREVPLGAGTFTGVDLAVQRHSAADLTAIFTILVHRDGSREVLEVQAGRWAFPDILSKIRDAHLRYGSTVIVENNAAQDFAVQALAGTVPVRGYTTGARKADPVLGVEGIGVEMSNAKWIIPNDGGKAHPEVEVWISDMLYYDPRSHTGDRLMASWLAVEGSRMSAAVAEAGRLDLHAR